MRGDALVGGTEDGVNAIESFEGIASGSWRTLIAMGGGVVEVVTAGALHEVAPGGGHVAELRGSSREDGFGEERITLAHLIVGGEMAVADHGSDTEPPVVLFDLGEGQPGDIDDGRGPHDAFAHEVDQVGTAGEE